MTGRESEPNRTPERDPRVDPQPGDMLAKGNVFTLSGIKHRTVARLPGVGPIHGGLGFRTSGRYRNVIWPLNIAAWRKWAATAQIIHRADGPAPGQEQE